MSDSKHLAVYLAGFNAETYDRADDPSADADGHVVTATVLRRESSDAGLVPVRVRVGHGVSPATASALLRKMADMIERNTDMLRGSPGLALRRMPDGSTQRKRITPEGLLKMAMGMQGEERERLLEMLDQIREQIADDPQPGDML
jgi:hypothetical protein